MPIRDYSLTEFKAALIKAGWQQTDSKYCYHKNGYRFTFPIAEDDSVVELWLGTGTNHQLSLNLNEAWSPKLGEFILEPTPINLKEYRDSKRLPNVRAQIKATEIKYRVTDCIPHVMIKQVVMPDESTWYVELLNGDKWYIISGHIAWLEDGLNGEFRDSTMQ